MNESEQTLESLVPTARLIAVGQLLAEVAHELNNSLQGVLGYSHLLISSPLAPDAQPRVRRIVEEAQRTTEILSRLLYFARPEVTEETLVDLNEVLTRVVQLKAYRLRTTDIRVEMDLSPFLLRTQGHAGRLESVFLNLVNNAQQAIGEAGGSGRLKIKSKWTGDGALVSIADDGPGMTRERLSRIFEPWFTTKETRGGTGLGLSISRDIIREHDGRIWAESEYGEGATFYVQLPSATPPTTPQAQVEPS